MNLSLVVPDSTPQRLVNSQLVSLPPAGNFNTFLLNLQYFVLISVSSISTVCLRLTFKLRDFNLFYFNLHWHLHLLHDRKPQKRLQTRARGGTYLVRWQHLSCERAVERLFHSKHFPECYSECPNVTLYGERFIVQGLGWEPAVANQLTFAKRKCFNFGHV